MASLKIDEADLPFLLSALGWDVTHLPIKKIKSIIKHGFDASMEIKIKPPLALTWEGHLFYSPDKSKRPIKMTRFDELQHVKGISSIAHGWDHGLILANNGEVFSFGSNEFGMCSILPTLMLIFSCFPMAFIPR